MIPIVLLTCPRETGEPFEYLEATRAELPGGLLVVDNTNHDALPSEREGWIVSSYKRPPGSFHGNKLAYWRALEVAFDSGAEEVLIFEDDLEFCRNALRRMETLPIPADVDWVQFFGPHVLRAARMFPGLWRPPRGSTAMFTQALKFRRRTLERLVEWKKDPLFHAFTASDQALDVAREALGLSYAVHAPEIVQHLGAISAHDPTEKLEGGTVSRVSLSYPGRDFDAMRLYLRDDSYR